jgi:hypothetical protein
MLKPATYITAKVPTSDRGTATAGIRWRQAAQEQEDHADHQCHREHQLELHVGTEARIDVVRSVSRRRSTDGQVVGQLRQQHARGRRSR